jgi:glycosyltransferase involved in cell wall biosynthesis
VESLATGTPVIAFDLGSMPELIDHGRTGFLVTDTDGAVAAVAMVGQLTRQSCRTAVVTRFSAERMVADYADLFARVAAGETPVSRASNSATSKKTNRTAASLTP